MTTFVTIVTLDSLSLSPNSGDRLFFEYMKLKITLLSLILSCTYSIAPAESPVADQQDPEEIKLGEILINASKTQTKLKEIPISVSALSSSVIENNEIHSLTDISAFIPNLFMPDYGSKLTSPVYIRGIGSRINSPSIGLYVDNIPYFEKAAFDFEFFDIRKIEVLRGPQGTLFGRNSMGGLINITTISPFDHQGTHIRLSAGTYGQYKLNFGYYAKINDRLAYSISGNYLQQDGFHTNHYLNSKVDSLQSLGIRLKLQYKITDNWSLDFVSNTDQSNQGGYPYFLYERATQTDGMVNYNQPSGYDRYLMSNAVNLRYQAANWEFSNNFSYQYLNDDQHIDQDFSPDSVYYAGQLQKQHNFANELTFRSRNSGRYSWLTGIFAFLQNAENTVNVDVYGSKLWYSKTYNPQTTGAALFHQSSYKILPSLIATAGIRFDYEQSEMQYAYRGKLAGTDQAPQDTVFPILRDNAILPMVSLAYQISENTNLYASYATGYKPGGFNSTFEKPEHLMFKKETSDNAEIGIKTALPYAMFLDAALFYSRIENQQIYRTAPSGRGSYLDNSGLSGSQGVELSLQSRSFRGFEGMLAYGYTHAEILEYELNETVNYNNKRAPYIPRHTFAIQGNQTFNITNSGLLDKIQINLQYNRTGELYWDLNNLLKEDPYGILNAKISFSRNNIRLDIWGKNLTNTRYHAFMFESGSNVFAQTGKPMQAGVNLSASF